MRVLVIGNGAREHTLVWKFSKSKRISGLFAAPGNAGTEDVSTNFPDLSPTDSEGIIKCCRENRINLVFVGPEAPLAAGLVDVLQRENIPVIGPEAKAARLESEKVFSKHFMERNGIPTALSREFKNYQDFRDYIKNNNNKHLVVKKNGLAGGKGVLESDDAESLLHFGEQILKTDSLLVEEYLHGFEVSVFALCDAKTYRLLPACSDYKKAGEGGTGPNTGGMGSICPVSWLDGETEEKIEEEIIKPTFEALKSEEINYRGVLYFGLMITEEGPKVLEYNVRFGDPETQVLLPLIESDFGNLCEAILNDKLDAFPLRISDKSTLGLVVASEGYPGIYPKYREVSSLPENSKELLVFHAATGRDGKGNLVTTGGRCFTVIGIGNDLLAARSNAYDAVKQVYFRGCWYRSDIGGKIFG